ncbi:head assembly chaperone protein [Providencia phage PSTRCR_121]|nr:head assembly chaperone protein [Providencia phage PSTRCR_121]UGO50251.1 putative head assembly cochaperone with GroEL [Morganella phage vB_MmoM_Rgz1]
MHTIKALGESVIIAAKADSAGTEEVSPMGIVVGVRQQGELPEYGIIYDVGEHVPAGYFEIGDKVPLPMGNMRNVPHPETVFNGKKASEFPTKYITAHYKSIAAVYK